jgi:hypothetical protein
MRTPAHGLYDETIRGAWVKIQAFSGYAGRPDDEKHPSAESNYHWEVSIGVALSAFYTN